MEHHMSLSRLQALPLLMEGLPQESPEQSRSPTTPLVSPILPRVISPLRIPRSLSYLNGLAIVLGLQIGSGIFSTPSAIVHSTGSPLVAIFVWFLAGLLAWTGAASFIELGSRIPINGGMQEYLRYCYGDTLGFLAAWSLVLLVKPCSIAMISLIFSEYLYRAFDVPGDPSPWILKGLAISAIVSITIINCMGSRTSSGVANFFLATKLVGLGSIILIGLTQVSSCFSARETTGTGKVERACFSGVAKHSSDLNSDFWAVTGSFTDAVLTALWAYSGWETLSIVTGELKDPSRNIPRVLHSAMAMVISLFMLANAAYFIVLPFTALDNTNTVALDFGRKLYGLTGALFYTWIVCLSCFGALNVKVFTAGRLTQAAAKRRWFPHILAITGSSETPTRAMVLNSCLAITYALIGKFRGLIVFAGMAENIAVCATVFGVIILRTRPVSEDVPSMYRTFISNPMIFCFLSAAVVLRSAVEHPVQGMIIVAFYASGILAYRWYFRSLREGHYHSLA